MTVNADLEPKTHHQTPMTCTYGYSHFRHFQNCCNRDGNIIFKYMNYVPIVVATDLEVHFSGLKKGVSQYFCLYSVCTSHWCLVMSFWLKVCIYSHTRGVKLGLGLGFMQTSQVLTVPPVNKLAPPKFGIILQQTILGEMRSLSCKLYVYKKKNITSC